MTESLIALAAMLVLSFLRLPIAIAMGGVGFLGLWWLRGLGPSMASATTVLYESGFEYSLTVVPLFILMGSFVTAPACRRSSTAPHILSSATAAVDWRWPPSSPAPGSVRSADRRSPRRRR